jgi:putative YphP/YqiW family bacilliredoxin
MYPEELVAPMRAELVEDGFSQLMNAEDVDVWVSGMKGTGLLVINSVCGCAAGTARPGVRMAVRNSEKKPNSLATVFAGMEKEAVDKAREYTLPFPPSSPAVALFKDGDLVHFVERHHIEGRSAEMIANHLIEVFKEYC